MKLIPSEHDSKALDQLFREAAMATPVDLIGQWRVNMLTGIVPSMYGLNHRKLIWADRDTKLVGGCNLLFRNYRWGHFNLEESTCNLDGQRALLIDYDVPQNGASRRLRDYIRQLAPGLFLGRFYCKVGKYLIFIGYFTLTKIDAE